MCGADADEVVRYFGVTANGNFVDPAHALQRQHPARVDRTENRPQPSSAAAPRCSRGGQLRIRPGLDNKVLLGWNALFLSALTEAAAALGRDDWMARGAYQRRFLLRAPGRLSLPEIVASAVPRVRRGLRGAARGAVTLAELDDVSGSPTREQVADEMIRLFQDRESGGFFTTGPRRRGARRPAEGSLRRRDAVGQLAGRQRAAPARGDHRRAALRRARDRDPRDARAGR